MVYFLLSTQYLAKNNIAVYIFLYISHEETPYILRTILGNHHYIVPELGLIFSWIL